MKKQLRLVRKRASSRFVVRHCTSRKLALPRTYLYSADRLRLGFRRAGARWRFFPISPDFLNWKSATKTKKRLVILGSISSGFHLQSPKQAQSRSFVKPGGIFRETKMAKNAKLGPKTCIYLYCFVFEARFHVPG